MGSDLVPCANLVELVTIENPFTANKTTDLETRDFARSVELFRQGIRLAHAKDLSTAKSKIAIAFLLDVRCARGLVSFISPGERQMHQYLLSNTLFHLILHASSPSAELEIKLTPLLRYSNL